MGGLIMTRGDETAAAIQRRFPGWKAWKSNAGRWWATRTGAKRAMPEHPTAEWSMTVDADTTQELRAVLSKQEQADVESSGYD